MTRQCKEKAATNSKEILLYTILLYKKIRSFPPIAKNKIGGEGEGVGRFKKTLVQIKELKGEKIARLLYIDLDILSEVLILAEFTCSF